MRTRAPKQVLSIRQQCLPPGSFFEFLEVHLHELVTDEMVSGIFDERIGRPSIPPEHLLAILLLRYFEGVSYEVASQRARFDIRWKAVLGRAPAELGPVVSDTTLNDFERALESQGRMHVLVKRTVQMAKSAGLLADELVVAQDSSPVVGKGKVEDTYNLLGTSIRRLVRAIAKEQHRPARELAKEFEVDELFARSTKATANIDWTDPEAKRGFLQRLVAQATKVVQKATELMARVDPREPLSIWKPVHEAIAIVHKVLAQDIERGADGQVLLRQEVAADRLISVHDPQMRRGHKTHSEAFEGYKFHITAEVTHGLVLSTEVTGANVHDSEPSERMAERAEETSGSIVVKAIGDCAYGTAKNRAAHDQVGRELVAKIPRPAKGSLFGKESFDIDLKGKTVTCPNQVCCRTSEVVRARNAEPGKEQLRSEERARLFVFPPGAVCTVPPSRRLRAEEPGLQEY